MQIDLPNETSVSSKQNCCSLKVFFEFGSTHIPSVNTDKLDKDQYSQSTIEPLDVKDANSLIDIINSEGTSTEALIWMGDKDSGAEDWVYETDVHDWPHQSHNFSPIFIEEFIMKSNYTDKVNCTRIALFQVYGTVFYWGRMYEDSNYKEGEWSLGHFHYFKLGFRHDVERFINQYLKIFSLGSVEPVQCTSVRPNRLPHTITLFQQHEDEENRKRKTTRKDAASESLRSRRKQSSLPRVRRQPLKSKQARVTKPRARKMKPDEKVNQNEVPNNTNTLQEHHETLSMKLKEHTISAIFTPDDISEYAEPLTFSGPTTPNVVEQYGQCVLDQLNVQPYRQFAMNQLNVQPYYVQSSLNQMKVLND
uniref:Uncharacterized protein n=1 Tax=Cacopsylla melanoneura TaxID=428564 RepID=A0A8D8TBN1_9HEMI